MMQFILEKADGTRTYSIIQNLPDDILDMLAVELRTMYYEETMDISVKEILFKTRYLGMQRQELRQQSKN